MTTGIGGPGPGPSSVPNPGTNLARYTRQCGTLDRQILARWLQFASDYQLPHPMPELVSDPLLWHFWHHYLYNAPPAAAMAVIPAPPAPSPADPSAGGTACGF